MWHSGPVNPSSTRTTGRVLTAVIAWLAGAATAVAIGLFALSSIDFGLTDRTAGQSLGDVSGHDSPAATPETVPSGATDSPSPSAGGAPRTINSPGGTVVARCVPGGVYLVSWSPAQGFHSEHVVRGPAEAAKVKFEGGGREYELTVKCVRGVPQASGDR